MFFSSAAEMTAEFGRWDTGILSCPGAIVHSELMLDDRLIG